MVRYGKVSIYISLSPPYSRTISSVVKSTRWRALCQTACPWAQSLLGWAAGSAHRRDGGSNPSSFVQFIFCILFGDLRVQDHVVYGYPYGYPLLDCYIYLSFSSYFRTVSLVVKHSLAGTVSDGLPVGTESARLGGWIRSPEGRRFESFIVRAVYFLYPFWRSPCTGSCGLWLSLWLSLAGLLYIFVFLFLLSNG